MYFTDEQIVEAYANISGNIPDDNTINTLQEGSYENHEDLVNAIIELLT